jgi:hypothetical protein
VIRLHWHERHDKPRTIKNGVRVATEQKVGFSRLRRARTESLGHNINSSDLGRPAPTFLKQQAGCSGAHMLGRYAFSLPDKIARGELRPLRNRNLVLEDA